MDPMMPHRIPEEDRDRLIDDLAMKLRMSTDHDRHRDPHRHEHGAAKPNGAWVKQQFTLGNLLTLLIAVVGAIVAYGNYREDQAQIRSTIERDAKDRDLRRLWVDEQLKAVNGRLERSQDHEIRIGNLEGSFRQVVERLNRSIDQRIDVDKEAASRQSELSTKIEVIGTQLKTMQSTLERMEARGREPGRPFARPQMWAKNKSDPTRKAQVRRRGVVKRTFLVGLTRSLERSFGKPAYRGPYLASLARWGRRRR
jgi:hypothetical protein